MVIGITGTLGAGKGAVVDYLIEKGFKHYSARAFFIEEVERRGLPVNRDTITETANSLTAEHGADYGARMLYERAEAAGGDAVIESIRRESEIDFLKNKGDFYLLAIDADPHTRYDRIVLRGSVTDKISFEKFLADEEREMRAHDPHKQNLSRCVELADYRIMNDGTFADLRKQVDAVLQDIAGQRTQT